MVAAALLVVTLTLAISACLSDSADDPLLRPTGAPIAEAIDPCDPLFGAYFGDLHEHFLHWAGGGSHLVFDVDDTIWALNVENGLLRQVADADADYESSAMRQGSRKFNYGFHADVRPDGSRIVYATCEFMRDEPLVDKWGGVLYSEGHEIAAVNLDGTGHERLTRNEHFENFPVWSPDGSRIAIYNPDRGLITVSPDGTGLRVLLEIDRDGNPHSLASTP